MTYLGIDLKPVKLVIKEGWFVRGRHELYPDQVKRMIVTRNPAGVIVAIQGIDRSNRPFAYGVSRQKPGLTYVVR